MPDFNIMESLLDEGEDNALLRYSMGSVFMKHEKYAQAAEQLARAVALKPDYLSAWRLYARALYYSGQVDATASVIDRALVLARTEGNEAAERELSNLVPKPGNTTR